jgi:hypothetical protein
MIPQKASVLFIILIIKLLSTKEVQVQAKPWQSSRFCLAWHVQRKCK